MTDLPIAYEPADFEPFTFNADDRMHLERELAARGVPAERHAGFIAALEQAIAMYNSGVVSDRSTLPSKTRKALRSCLKALGKLERQFEALDTARGRASLAAVGVDLDELLNLQFVDLRSRLGQAVDQPVPDKEKNHTQYFLLKDVALAFPEHLQIDSSSTKGGLYEAVLEIVIRVAKGSEIAEPNALARKGQELLRD